MATEQGGERPWSPSELHWSPPREAKPTGGSSSGSALSAYTGGFLGASLQSSAVQSFAGLAPWLGSSSANGASPAALGTLLRVPREEGTAGVAAGGGEKEARGVDPQARHRRLREELEEVFVGSSGDRGRGRVAGLRGGLPPHLMELVQRLDVARHSWEEAAAKLRKATKELAKEKELHDKELEAMKEEEYLAQAQLRTHMGFLEEDEQALQAVRDENSSLERRIAELGRERDLYVHKAAEVSTSPSSSWAHSALLDPSRWSPNHLGDSAGAPREAAGSSPQQSRSRTPPPRWSPSSVSAALSTGGMGSGWAAAAAAQQHQQQQRRELPRLLTYSGLLHDSLTASSPPSSSPSPSRARHGGGGASASGAGDKQQHEDEDSFNLSPVSSDGEGDSPSVVVQRQEPGEGFHGSHGSRGGVQQQQQKQQQPWDSMLRNLERLGEPGMSDRPAGVEGEQEEEEEGGGGRGGGEGQQGRGVSFPQPEAMQEPRFFSPVMEHSLRVLRQRLKGSILRPTPTQPTRQRSRARAQLTPSPPPALRHAASPPRPDPHLNPSTSTSTSTSGSPRSSRRRPTGGGVARRSPSPTRPNSRASSPASSVRSTRSMPAPRQWVSPGHEHLQQQQQQHWGPHRRSVSPAPAASPGVGLSPGRRPGRRSRASSFASEPAMRPALSSSRSSAAASPHHQRYISPRSGRPILTDAEVARLRVLERREQSQRTISWRP